MHMVGRESGTRHIQRETMDFKARLKEEIIESGKNYYTDNYDYYSHPVQLPFKKRAVNFGKWLLFRKPFFQLIFKSEGIYQNIFLGKMFGLTPYMDRLDSFYNKLEEQESKDLLVKLIAFRILGYLKVKLPYHTPNFWKGIDATKALRDENDFIALNFEPFKLYRHNMPWNGIDLKVYNSTKCCYSTVIREHYALATTSNGRIEAEEGDVVLDLGGSYGDTALYFAHMVGANGKVYSFEFIPGSIEIFEKNLDLNETLKPRIAIIDNPLWNESDREIYFKDQGAASQVRFEKFEGFEGTRKTVTIDDFVERHGVEKVDFIKTDIEGAEPYTIEGAVQTLKKFKPKLAISIYHGMDDFVGIIDQIDALNLGYKFYLGHASIYSSETVLFCTTR